MFKGSDAPKAGSELRAAREQLGWALYDVAAMLRIRASFLEALEAGQLTALPNNVYALGYLRNYATSLGLDAEDFARRFRDEAGEIPRHSELIFPSPVPDRGLPAGALILLGLVLVGSAYVGWYRLSGEGRLPAETVVPVPTRLANLAEQAIPGPDGRVPVPEPPPAPAPRQSDSDNQFEPQQAAEENPLLMPDPPPPSPPPMEEVKMSSIPGGGTATTAIAMPVTPVMSQGAGWDGRGNADGARIVLRITGETWVQVKERAGQVLIAKVMQAGETFPVPVRDNLVLSTGNAGRVDILVDGKLAPSIGSAGAVRKEVALDPELLKAGSLNQPSAKR
jgi:cytoskeleton protein RodZ